MVGGGGGDIRLYAASFISTTDIGYVLVGLQASDCGNHDILSPWFGAYEVVQMVTLTIRGLPTVTTRLFDLRTLELSPRMCTRV